MFCRGATALVDTETKPGVFEKEIVYYKSDNESNN